MLADTHPDLTSCDREPIHEPGAIQPHGVLFAASAGDLRLTSVSANAGKYCGQPAAALLDVPLSRILAPASFSDVERALAQASAEPVRLARLGLSASPSLAWRGIVHAIADSVLLEAEMLPPDADVAALQQFDRFQQASQSLMGAHDVATTQSRLVEAVRRLTGYSRVLMYRFAPDWSGEVIAEDSDGQMPSYLGLHFPASDIPVQARALYATNAERQIPDSNYEKVPLLHRVPTSLDLSHVGLRSVSPVHCLYLRNMGVAAAMSVSVMRDGRLWGLVTCHHPSPRRVTPEIRQSCVLLAQIAAARLALVEAVEIARRSVAVKSLEGMLLNEAAEGEDNRSVLMNNSSLLLGLVGADGLALNCNGVVTVLGATPPAEPLSGVLKFLAARGPPELPAEQLVTEHFASHYAPAAGIAEAAGILAMPLGTAAGNGIVWFRGEMRQTVSWAGNPDKPVETVAGEARLTPRRSFEKWTQEVRGRSKPWSKTDLAAATSLRDTLVEVVVRRSAEIQRMNTLLVRSNQELESFAYIASHDLKEPLRQIEVFGSLLQRAFARKTDSAEKIDRWFDGISTSSKRLRALIDHLADFARIGSEAKVLAPVDIGALLASVLDDFSRQLTDARGTVACGPLPVLMCDATQMRQAIQNLIGNAIKYRHPDRALRIVVTATAPPPAPEAAAPLTWHFRDNGIGFDERHSERIFKPFERLHSAEDYDGSGLGLAICRKVIERHGGTITATSRLGEGSDFCVTLPVQLLPPDQASLP